MPRHRLEPERRVRPRYGRMAAAGLSVTVTMIALLGGLGVLPVQLVSSPGDTGSSGHGPTAKAATTGASGADVSRDASPASGASTGATPAASESPPATALPDGSGSGRRVVFSTTGQRVWLVDANGTVRSTYLVSGSVTHNLAPGTYAVYSRSRWAVGVDDSGVMQYFVRFAHGPKAAIGFHSIPTKHGTPLQSVAQLGTPQSHGCIRQRLSDAERMWGFADVGTPVVVLA